MSPSPSPPVQIWLERNGAQTALATCAATADTILRTRSVDAVVCDVHMPGNHRLQWVQRLAAQGCTPPLFLLTGRPEMETALAAANLPVTGYLIKPPDFAELGSRLLASIRCWRMRRDLLVRLGSLVQHGDLAELAPELEGQLKSLNDFLQQHRIGLREHDSDVDWPAVIRETIAVLAKTKGSFHSKELAALRQRLTELLTMTENRPAAS